MAQLADEYTPERDSYQTRVRPTPVRRAAPSPTLPPWVQARLKEQAQAEARRKTVEAARAKEAAAQARREAAAFDRLASVNLRALVPKPAAKQLKTVSRAPKVLPVAQFRSPTFDELAAPRVPVRPTLRPAPTAPVVGPPPRDTAEYYAYLKGVINGTTQGVASGVGSFSDAGEPARRTESTRPRPFSLLSNQDDELAAARVPVRSTPPSSDSGVAVGAPPRGTPAYDAYLREMLNGTTQGIAPGVGSLSNPGELLVRSGSNELTLAEKLRDGFIPASGERSALAKFVASPSVGGPPPRGTPAYDAYLREMLNGTTQGIAPGVGRLSEPDEPSSGRGPTELTLAEKLRDGFVPGSGARVSGDAREPRSPSIGDLGEEERRLLRNMEYELASGPGAPGAQDGDGFDPLGWGLGLARRGADLGIDGARAGIDLGIDAGTMPFELGKDALGLGLDATGAAYDYAIDVPGEAYDFGIDRAEDLAELSLRFGRQGEAGLRTVGSELGEIGDLGPHDLRERVHQALLGQVTGRGVDSVLAEAIVNWERPDFSDTGASRALQGLLGNETYSGDDHPFVGAFPEGSAVRDIGDPLLEWVTDPFALKDAGFGAWTGAKVGGGPWGAVGGAAGGLGWALLDEISSEDSELAGALEEHIVDPTEESLRSLNELIWRGLDQRNWVPRYTP